MTPDRERWAEAAAIKRIHGAHGPVWIATRIGALALAGDIEGVRRFVAIAAIYEQMLAGTRQ